MDRNPFTGTSTSAGHDPFADAAVATAPDDNPFEHSANAKVAEPAYSTDANAKRSNANVKSVGGFTEEDLRVREENLKRREQELSAREKEVENRETTVRSNAGFKAPNWPSRCYPIDYHDIDADIPEENRTLVRRFYYVCILTWIGLFWNWLIFLIAYFATTFDVSSDVLWSSIYLVLGVPGSWKLWYKNLYTGTRTKSNANWIAFFITFFMHWVLAILIGVGVPSCNGAGLLTMLKWFANSWNGGGVCALISTAIWVVILASSTILAKQAQTVWKVGGGSDRLARESAAAQAMGSVALNAAASQPAASAV